MKTLKYTSWLTVSDMRFLKQTFRLCRFLKWLMYGFAFVMVIVQYTLLQQAAITCTKDNTAAIKDDSDVPVLDIHEYTSPLKTSTSVEAQTTQDPLTPHCHPLSSAHVVGNQRKTVGYMTVGIPSIYRPNTTNGEGYLETTLDSLIKNLGPSDRAEVTIVVFLSDFNRTFTNRMIEHFKGKFEKELNIGVLLIFTMPQRCYPRLDNLPRTFNDAPERVKWRSKQVIDYAFLWQFASNISQYYMQLEDDVITTKDYLSRIKEFVNKQRKPWILLEFAKLGFIGKFYRTHDVTQQANFVVLFYYRLPIDWLLGYFVKLMAQKKPIYIKQSIFQHIGSRSSLGGSFNPLKEKSFNQTRQ